MAFSCAVVLPEKKIPREYFSIYVVTKAVKVLGIRVGIQKWQGLDSNVISVSEAQGYVRMAQNRF